MSRKRASRQRPWFTRLAGATSRATGKPGAFFIAAGMILVWGISGPLFGFSDTWQLVINTSTTIITFLMVFLIQNSQQRDSQAIQIKLDELIRSIDGAHLALLDLEELDVDELQRICSDYRKLAEQAREDLREGKTDTQVREVGSQIRDQEDARKKRPRPPRRR